MTWHMAWHIMKKHDTWHMINDMTYDTWHKMTWRMTGRMTWQATCQDMTRHDTILHDTWHNMKHCNTWQNLRNDTTWHNMTHKWHDTTWHIHYVTHETTWHMTQHDTWHDKAHDKTQHDTTWHNTTRDKRSGQLRRATWQHDNMTTGQVRSEDLVSSGHNSSSQERNCIDSVELSGVEPKTLKSNL